MAYSAGETFFGLPVTTYPELEKTKEELGQLAKLYDLFTTVLDAITGFNDMHWADVVGFTDTPIGPESNISIWSRSSRSSSWASRRCPRSCAAGTRTSRSRRLR